MKTFAVQIKQIMEASVFFTSFCLDGGRKREHCLRTNVHNSTGLRFEFNCDLFRDVKFICTYGQVPDLRRRKYGK